MARQTQVILVDDLDGGDAQSTVSFGLDGTFYEIDLNKKNEGRMRDALAPYIGAARKVGRAAGRTGGRRGGGVGGGVGRERAQDIRAWARSQGLKVSDRGRIPAEVVAQYEAEH